MVTISHILNEFIKKIKDNFTYSVFKYGVLVLGDARRLIRFLPSGRIDAIITDPPFGLGMDKYDDSNVFFEIEDEMYRVLKKDAWLIFYYTTKKLYNAFKFKKFEYVWMITCIFHSTISKCVIGDRSYIPIMIFRKGNKKVIYRRSDVIIADELPIVSCKIKNPLFKPTYSSSVLLQMFTKDGDIVLDPFAGFGSIPLVCELFNRYWIGFEIDKRKYDIAVEFIHERRVSRSIRTLNNNNNLIRKLEDFF